MNILQNVGSLNYIQALNADAFNAIDDSLIHIISVIDIVCDVITNVKLSQGSLFYHVLLIQKYQAGLEIKILNLLLN